MTLKSLTERALDNWPAKIVCIALALLLSMFYRMSTLEERFFSIPLEVRTNGDIVPASNYPRMVKVSLRGETDNIYPILDSDIVAYLDLTPYAKEGEFRVAIRTELKGTALDVSPLEISTDPVELSVRVEHRMAKKVSVTPSFRGYPEAGFEFTGYTLAPQDIEVFGPRSAVEKITDVVTEPIELSGKDSTFAGSVAAVNRNTLVALSGGGKIDYQVTISQTTLIKNFEDVPFYFENLDPSLEVETDKVSGTLQIKGTQTDLAEWSLPENALTILCENVTAPGVYSLPVRTIVPQPYEVIASSPGQVQLTVRGKAQ
jgi:YbbR domain-containing protein